MSQSEEFALRPMGDFLLVLDHIQTNMKNVSLVNYLIILNELCFASMHNLRHRSLALVHSDLDFA